MGFLDDISKAADSIKKTTDGVESDIEDVFNLFHILLLRIALMCL